MSLIDLTKDLQNFKWTNPSKIGNANNPQSFDLNGNIVTGEKTFDRPSKSALDGMESIFGPKFSNVGTRGSYGVTDYMDGTKQGRGFIPPGGPPKGFTVDMGKSEYVIGSTGYTLTPLSHTIAQMNSSLPYGVVPEQTINDIPISPGAWGDYNVPIANYSSTWTPEQISGNASNFDAIYDRTLSYIPNIPEPELPIFSQFMRGSGGLNRFDLTSPNFGSTPFTFIEDIPYVIPQTNLTGPTTSPFVPNLFNNTPKLEHAHSVDPISRLMSYPGLYVGSQGDINQTAPQPLYSTPDYGVFTGPVDAFNHTELRSRLYDVYQHHFQPTDVNFVNIPYGDNLFGEDEAWKGGSIHIGAQDPDPTIGGGVTYYGSLVSITPRGSIYRAGDGTYRVPQSGHTTIPPGVTTQYPSNIPTFDGTQITHNIPQITLTGPFGNDGYQSIFDMVNGKMVSISPDAHGSDFMTTPLASYTSQWATDTDGTFTNPIDTGTHTVNLITLTGHTSNANIQTVLNTDSSYVFDAHGSNFTTTPINAQSSIFASSVEGFFKHTVHQHGFPGITMITMNESGDIIDGTPPTRDEVMYIPGTFAQSIHGGPIFGNVDHNIFKQFSNSPTLLNVYDKNSPNFDPNGTGEFVHEPQTPYVIKYWDGFGVASTDSVYSSIDAQVGQQRQTTGKVGSFNAHEGLGSITRPTWEDAPKRGGGYTIEFLRGGMQIGKRVESDTQRLIEWGLGNGGMNLAMFSLKQFALQALNPRPETRLWNPLSTLASIVPAVHMKRHTTLFGAMGSDRYGSFDDSQGGESYWKNKEGFLLPELSNWGYGNLDEDKPFGQIDFTSALTLRKYGNSRLTALSNKFLIFHDDDPGKFSLSGFIEKRFIELGRTPATPTQYVFSQKGALSKGKAFSNVDHDVHSGELKSNPGIPGSISYWLGNFGIAHWAMSFTSGDIDRPNYISSPYSQLDPRFSYMNAFKQIEMDPVTAMSLDSKANSLRGGHRNAALDTKFYSPLIQFSWRFFNPNTEEVNYSGGQENWHTNDQDILEPNIDYRDKSFTTDPKNSLVKKYGLMTYGEISNKKYESTPTYYNENRLKQTNQDGMITNTPALAESKQTAMTEITDVATADLNGDAKENFQASMTAGGKRKDIYGKASELFDAATKMNERTVAAVMSEIAASSKKAAKGVGDQGPKKSFGKAVPDAELGMIKKYNSKYKGDNTDKVNMIPYGNDYGDTEDFIKFKFKDIINNKFIIFRALLSGISDTITPEWEATRFIGRPDDVHVYKGTSRKVSFSFDVYPKTKQEFPVILEKLNFLIGLNYPSFQNNRMVAPFIELTLGDMFNATPGYIDGVTITPQDNSTWEMDMGLQFPKHMQVQCDFTYIGKYMPSSLGKHYELPWLVDQGWTTDVDNKAASAGTFLLEGGSVTDEKMYPQRDSLKSLFTEIQPPPT
jgi:hypothetical protein